MKPMKKGMKDNIDRKKPSINDVTVYEGIPMFSFIELNINEICNRVCPFCPRVDPESYPNQNIHMDVELAKNIANQLRDINFSGIVNISGTGEPLLTKHVVEIVKQFGDKNIHIEIVTNGDVLKRKKGKKLIKDLYSSGLKQLVVSMYDGPEQIDYFNSLFSECGIDKDLYSLRDRWYDESEDYGLLYTNRAGNIGDKLASSKSLPCYYTHYAMYVDWNGDTLVCCQDMYNRTINFGNVKETNIFDIWKNSKIMKFRDYLSKGDRSLSPCNNCNANGRIFGDNHVKAWNNYNHATGE